MWVLYYILGQVGDLIDMVLDSFIKRSVTGGFGSRPADVMADTSVALASANVELVSRKVVSRILHVSFHFCRVASTAVLVQSGSLILMFCCGTISTARNWLAYRLQLNESYRRVFYSSSCF